MHALTDVIEIDFPHRDAADRPAGTLENIEAVIAAFGVVVARPPLNAAQFVPFFGRDRCPGAAPENVRDVHLSKLHDICQRHRLEIDIDTLARHLQLIGLEVEDRERQQANGARLRRGGA